MKRHTSTPVPSNAKRPSLGAQFSSDRLRLSKEIGLATDDIVVSVGHANVDESEVSFCGHQINGKYGVFTINDVGTGQVKHVGTAQSSVNNVEYYLAFVNEKTGQAVEFRPVSLVQCEAKYQPKELGMNEKSDTEDADANINQTNYEEIAARRRSLTAQFGSIKQNKFLDNSNRRRVNEHTLTAITPTVFNNALTSTPKSEIKTEIDDAKTPLASISLLKKAESTVLPLPNLEAIKACDVYSLEQFLPEAGVLCDQLESEAVEFFKQYSTCKAIVDLGVSKLLADRVSCVLSLPNASKAACVALRAIVMSKLLADIFGEKKKAVDVEEVMNLEFPPLATSSICDDYLSSDLFKNKRRYQLLDKAKLQAHFLCLLMLFDVAGYTVPISCVTDFKINEITAIRLLKGMGCEIVAATTAENHLYNSIRLARLTGPPREKIGRRRSSRAGGMR